MESFIALLGDFVRVMHTSLQGKLKGFTLGIVRPKRSKRKQATESTLQDAPEIQEEIWKRIKIVGTPKKKTGKYYEPVI